MKDLLPDIGQMLVEETKRFEKYWGKLWAEILAKPTTNEDLLFGALVALRETALRMQGVLIKQKIGQNYQGIPNYELLRDYVETFKGHVGRIIIFLEDLGFDMEKPPKR